MPDVPTMMEAGVKDYDVTLWMAYAMPAGTPNAVIEKLRAGDKVLITGVMYTARDAAHKRLIDLLNAGKELPVDLKGQIVYYVGPTPERPGEVIGSAGPTTSGRMDAYAPRLIAEGLKGMIGKGLRSKAVKDAISPAKKK